MSADTVVPAGVQGLDRYAYAENNPLRYTDPSGHEVCQTAEEWYQPVCREMRSWQDRGVHFTGEGWNLFNLQSVITGLGRIERTIGDYDLTQRDLGLDQEGGLTIFGGSPDACETNACAIRTTNTIVLELGSLSDVEIVDSMAHEAGHIIDFQAANRRGYTDYYSEVDWVAVLPGWEKHLAKEGKWIYKGERGYGKGYVSAYAVQKGPWEDFAETFQARVDMTQGYYRPGIVGRVEMLDTYGLPSAQRNDALDAAIYGP